MIARLAGLASIPVAMCAAPPVHAQSNRTHHEFWPELQIFVEMPERTQIILMTDLVRDRDTRDTSKAHFSLLADHRVNDILSLRTGYTYAYAPAVKGDEYRILFEQTLGFGLPWGFDLRLRTREELRWIDGVFSARFRERVKLERPVTLFEYRFSPYVSGELYYDTRYDAFSRHQLLIGSEFPLSHRVSIDLYGAREDNWTPKHSITYAVGFVVMLKL